MGLGRPVLKRSYMPTLYQTCTCVALLCICSAVYHGSYCLAPRQSNGKVHVQTQHRIELLPHFKQLPFLKSVDRRSYATRSANYLASPFARHSAALRLSTEDHLYIRVQRARCESGIPEFLASCFESEQGQALLRATTRWNLG
jgi:hypothetical protein